MSLGIRDGKGRLVRAVLAAFVGAALNCALSFADVALGSPLFFDSIFTAASGFLLGPWFGCLCALATHVSLTAAHGWDFGWMNFLPCSLATGLIAGLFSVRRRSLTIEAVVLCALSVALANAVLGAIIADFLYRGLTTHTSDYLVAGLILMGQSVYSSAFLARVGLNLVDKGITVALAFGLYSIPRLRALFGLSPLSATKLRSD